MDPEEKDGQDKIKIGVIGIFLVGLFVLAVGLGLTFFKKPSSDGIQIISAQSSSPTSEIIIHVDGAVVSPGVYRLAANSRVDDAIQAAGGFASDADEARVNLAAKVGDGQKIYVSKVSEVSNGGVAGVSESGFVSINNGSQSQLESLPGIGPVTAQKIIASRPYSFPEELLSKKVVSSSVWKKVKDLISI